MSPLRTILLLTLLLLTITVDASAQCYTDNDESSSLTYQAIFYHYQTAQFSAAKIQFQSVNAKQIIRAPPVQI